jgi:hypothetical protein
VTCGIWLSGPQAAELQWIEAEFGRVDAARVWLVDRRRVLLAELRQLASADVPSAPPVVSVRQSYAGAPRAVPGDSSGHSVLPGVPDWVAADRHDREQRPARQRPEVSGRTVARVLVAAGAALVVIAATVFTVADWGRVGPLARCAILLAVTAIVLAAPRPLARRGLHATAESISGIGLALTLGDAYLVHELVPGHLGGLLPGALASAVLAAVWAGYGLATRIRTPWLAAMAMAQLSIPLATAGAAHDVAGPGYRLAGPLALALIATCGADVWLARRLGGARPAGLAVTAAWIAACVAWVSGVLAAATDLVSIPANALVLWPAATFVAAAMIGIVVVPQYGPAWLAVEPAAVVSGGLLAIGLTLPMVAVLPSGWGLASAALAGAVVSAGALLTGGLTARHQGTFAARGDDSARADGSARADRQATRIRLDLVASGSAAVLGFAGLLSLPAVVARLLPERRLVPFWSGVHGNTALVAQVASLPGTRSATVVLALVGLVSGLAPARRSSVRSALRAVALISAALAIGSLPATVGLAGWSALAVLTAGAGALLGIGVAAGVKSAHDRSGEQHGQEQHGQEQSRREPVALTATLAGIALTTFAVLWSLTGPAPTVAELAAVTMMFAVAAALGRDAIRQGICTAGAPAAAAGLAVAIPLGAGWPARYAGFAVLAVAVVAIAAATRLRRAHPVHALVLDLGAAPIALIAALMSATQSDSFAVLAASVALIASAAAWLRTGLARLIILAVAVMSAVAAAATEHSALAAALFTPFGQLAHAWRGHGQAYVQSASAPGLPLAAVVFAACLSAVIAAIGAWRGSGRSSLDAVAASLPLIAAPVGLASGFGYYLTVALLLALTLALTAWAALARSLAPAGSTLIAAALTVAWALAAPAPTLIVLGSLVVAFAMCAWRSRLPGVRIGGACLAVVTSAALAGCSVLAAGGAVWQSGLVMLVVAAAAQVAAFCVSVARGAKDASAHEDIQDASAPEIVPVQWRIALALELTGWLAAIAGTAQCLAHANSASLALAIVGVTCLGVALRPDRRRALWAGLVLCEVAWCVWLAAAGVNLPEPYAVPAAAIALALGWDATRRQPELGSWLAYGLGLSVLLLPSLVMVWAGSGWVRPLTLGVVAAAVTLTGARHKLQAPLLIGVAVLLLDAGHALAPAVRTLAHWLPGWVPIALIGAVLLWAGATYEARLRNLGSLRRSLATMR